jgi:hypothetical protein
LSRSVTQRERRTYFNNPLVEESLRHLPAALNHPRSTDFRDYLVQHLHHNSHSTRLKAAEYISIRFAKDGAINLALAAAIKKFGDSPIGREIFYFEFLQAIPMLQEIAIRWLAELPPAGVPRSSLISFLDTRLGGRSSDKVASSAVQAFKLLGRVRVPKPAFYIPVRPVPPPEAFLYILARHYPEPTMVRLETFAGENIIRAMLWPSACIPGLLKAAESAGHVSKISQLDQYHQFTLSGTGEERMRLLLGDALPAPKRPPEPLVTILRESDSHATEFVPANVAEESLPMAAQSADQLNLFKGSVDQSTRPGKAKRRKIHAS